MNGYSISEEEYLRRIGQVRNVLNRKNLDALYLTSGISMFYLTGYSFISTERPAALIIPADGKITFLGPLLEKDHVPLETNLIQDVRTYIDYPGKRHPIDLFAGFLSDMGLARKRIGIDNRAGATSTWGYIGEPLTKKLDARFVDVVDLVPSMRLIKSEEEIRLMQESCKWANLAMALLQDYTADGLWDVDVEMAAARETSEIMKKTLGPEYAPKRNILPVNLCFRGQIGEMSAIPHSIASKRTIRKGDVVIGEVGVDLGGYTCELERTMIVGKPTPKQIRYFGTMVKAQEAAFEAFRPNARCCDIDEAANSAFTKTGMMDWVKHHVGHGLGLEVHEPPWLDVGNSQTLVPGMIVSCEPGIYEKGFAGFRHSDTVLMKSSGGEILTYYPRDIDALTIS